MNTCPSCNKQNRDNARFCKWCGSKLELAQNFRGFESLVGKSEIKSELEEIIKHAKSMTQRMVNSSNRLELSFVITGEPGCGKETIAHAIAEELFINGINDASSPTTIIPVDYEDFIKNIDERVQKIGNSVLIIDDADKLVPDGEATEIAKIDYILSRIKDWKGNKGKPIVIFTGHKRLRDYFNNNPDQAAKINYFFEVPDVGVDDLVEITRRILVEKYSLELTPEATAKLHRIYVNDQRNPEDAKGSNGHNAAKRAYEIQYKCSWSSNITPDMIEGKEFIPKTFDEIMADFEKYVGVDEIKKTLNTIANNLEIERQRNGNDAVNEVRDHFLFLGNPGTGKTTMARLFANALNALGALPVGQLIEVSRAELVSQYMGDTPKQVTHYVDKAMGGILFIDEAYSLKSSEHDSFGQEAVDTLIQLAENRRGKLVIVMAGYDKEMREFLQSNSGFESRFKPVMFRDYTGPELTEIFRRMVSNSKEKYTLSADADEHIGQFFERMYKMRTRTFGNAREVRTIYEKAISSLNKRIQKAREDGTYNTMMEQEIILSDIEGDTPPGESSVEDILKKFDDLIGMDDVKKQIRSLANRVRNDRKRALITGTAVQPKIHIMLTGNPGTGKTVVAKRLGEVFKAMGVLTRGHVVERERRTLLDSYANSAGINMDKAVDEAMGGVLFIDEAYNLIPADPSHKDKDGTAAIEALMTRMENDAGKFITVIAGYKTEIEEFVANANPGLKRRFTYKIHIKDYSVDDLIKIFLLQAKKENLTLTEEAEELLEKKIQEMVTMKEKNFGNAGEMVNLFNEVKNQQAQRLEDFDDPTEEQLLTIEAADIPYDTPKKIDIDECMKELNELVGLSSVKDAVQELADTIKIEQKRAEETGRKSNINLDHYLFLGNPGTGKTTVARIMGNIFYTLGVLPSNKVVEVTPKDLIASYVGQTGPKTAQMIDRALGGILFIDEAYGLNDGSINGFGKDAMTVLLTKLLDYKGKLICIAAGYPREMQQWLNTNSGAESRFTRVITFEDYGAEELATIFRNIAKNDGMSLDPLADQKMLQFFTDKVNKRSNNFANAREARNYYDRVKLNQGRRLSNSGYADNKEELFLFRKEDMEIKPIN